MAKKTGPAPLLPKLGKHHYARELRRLQIELVKLHRHVIAGGRKVLVILTAGSLLGFDIAASVTSRHSSLNLPRPIDKGVAAACPTCR